MSSIHELKSRVERGKRILKFVVEDFIETATPVPSVRLKKKFHIALSPASIRNTLHELECEGFLNHLHASSGKIPTDSGYRLYVDELMDTPIRSYLLKRQIMEDLSAVAFNVERILQITADSLARLSNLFGFAFWSPPNRARLTDLELISLSSGKLLLVLGFESDVVKSIVINVTVDVKASHLDTVASVLRECLFGLDVREIQKTIAKRLKSEEIFESEIVQIIVKNANAYFTVETEDLLCTSQKDLLFQHPEFSRSSEIQSIVSALDDGNVLKSSASNVLEGAEPHITIGKENRYPCLQRCSIVTAAFRCGKMTGHLGIVGPTRMSYQEAHALVNTFRETIPTLLDG